MKVTYGRVDISWPAAATPMIVETPQPLWHASNAALITCTYKPIKALTTKEKYESTNIASTIKSIIKAAIGDLNKIVLYFGALQQFGWVHELGGAHLFCPRFFTWIDTVDSSCTGHQASNQIKDALNRYDPRRTDCSRGGDDTKANGTATKHPDG
jgi:hypothetical protein